MKGITANQRRLKALTLDELLINLHGVKGSGSQYYAKCPAHEDNRASLSIKQTENGRIFLNCHAGCSFHDICDALNVKPSELRGETTQMHTTAPQIVATYEYKDLNGNVILKKYRKSDKSFSWYNPATDKWNKQGVSDMLYRQELVPSAPSVFIVEGEKDADNINKLVGKVFPFPAVSPSNGCKTQWKQEFSELLKGKYVVILPDNDKPGEEFAQKTAAALKGVAAVVMIAHLKDVFADLPEKGDISDALQKYGNEAIRSSIPKLVNDKNIYSGEKENVHKLRQSLSLSAAELDKTILPDTKFLVEVMLPEGSTIISAPSKAGKSWLVLDMGLSIASGTTVLGFQANKTGVLYLALEDSWTRLQKRMRLILGSNPAPKNLYFMTEFETLDEGFFEHLDEELKAHPEISVVIIDTLQKIRGQALPRETAYAQDYREMGAIKKFMDERHISPIMVHHTRKMRDDCDPFNMISGTNGIMGAFDTSMTLIKEKRTDENAVLSITGRDVEQRTDIVSFNKAIHRWERVGDYKTIREKELKAELESNLIAKTIKTLIEESPVKRWDGTASELMREGERITETYISPSVKKLGHELKAFSPDLLKYCNIIMETTTHGNAGKVYHFYMNGSNNYNQTECNNESLS